MKKFFIGIAILFSWTWKVLTTVASLATNLIFLLVVFFVAAMLLYQPRPQIPDGCALVIAPRGSIVEQASPMHPMSRALNRIAGIDAPDEIPLQDILDVIDAAADDERIKILVLSPSRLEGAGFNQLRDIGSAIERFRASGKPVIAADDTFGQGQYYLAAFADEIYMNPVGRVNLHGIGVYRLYFRELLHKLDIGLHVFKVGEFKSALEPFLRDNMSEEAKKANLHWLERLWDTYCADIGRLRGLPPGLLTSYINNLDRYLADTDGDAARAALNLGLIDGLKTRGEMEDYLSSLVGREADSQGFRHVTMNDYLDSLTPSYTVPGTDSGEVAIITATGNIVPGEGTVGQIGADTLIRRIRRAEEDDGVRALVLRIDSGGGSAFASELIRRALLRVREAGKPVVVSMGALAASGAYWLSADADAILASPVTLTGSIGIFGALPDLSNSLSRLGISSDGVGTTDMAAGISATRELPPALSRSLQMSVEFGYRTFISIVAEGRHIPLERVQDIARGRVWDGETALQLGLVDELGSLADAVERAADLAGLPHARGIYLEATGGGLLEDLEQFGNRISLDLFQGTLPAGVLRKTDELFPAELRFFLQKNDPGDLYAHSLLGSPVID